MFFSFCFQTEIEPEPTLESRGSISKVAQTGTQTSPDRSDAAGLAAMQLYIGTSKVLDYLSMCRPQPVPTLTQSRQIGT